MLQDKKYPSLDETCDLISLETEQDEIGNEIKKRKEERVCCAELPIAQSEFYRAAQRDIKTETILVVNQIDYAGQQEVRYKKTISKVYRVYERADELIELYLEERSGIHED